MNAAAALAASPDAADHARLASALANEHFLNRLDREEDYLGPARQLRLARVLRALMDNPVRSAGQVLEYLTQQPGFFNHTSRQLLLIQALVVIRPASPVAVAFWDRSCRTPEGEGTSPFLTVTIWALADNGTRPGLELLEAKMVDPEIDPAAKISWMHRPILIHRNEILMLQACDRMLRSGMSEELRPVLVESLFDYQPRWYQSTPPIPPLASAMEPEARHIAREIAQHALSSIPLDDYLRARVEEAL